MNIKTICLAVTSFVCVVLFAAFETPQQAINASRKAIQSKNYAEAHKNLTEGYKLAVNPTERILILNQHANLYAMQRDWKNAEKMIMMIINDKAAVPAQKASAWLTIARFKENQRKYEEAVGGYDIRPRHKIFFVNLGDDFRMRQDKTVVATAQIALPRGKSIAPKILLCKAISLNHCA